jgi:hypothetical protein
MLDRSPVSPRAGSGELAGYRAAGRGHAVGGGLARHLVAEFAACDGAALAPVDGSGFRQLLCAVVRTGALRAALGELGEPGGRSLRELMCEPSRTGVRRRGGFPAR